MTRWAPAKSDTLEALAAEILHNYARGRVLVAVDGPDRAGAAAFADDLRDTMRDQGHDAFRASADSHGSDFREAAFRRDIVDTFRATEGDAILLVDAALTDRAGIAGVFNYGVWVVGDFVADRSPEGRSRATAVIDNSDPEHPLRLFDDAC